MHLQISALTAHFNGSVLLGVDTEAFDWFPMGGSRPA